MRWGFSPRSFFSNAGAASIRLFLFLRFPFDVLPLLLFFIDEFQTRTVPPLSFPFFFPFLLSAVRLSLSSPLSCPLALSPPPPPPCFCPLGVPTAPPPPPPPPPSGSRPSPFVYIRGMCCLFASSTRRLFFVRFVYRFFFFFIPLSPRWKNGAVPISPPPPFSFGRSSFPPFSFFFLDMMIVRGRTLFLSLSLKTKTAGLPPLFFIQLSRYLFLSDAVLSFSPCLKPGSFAFGLSFQCPFWNVLLLFSPPPSCSQQTFFFPLRLSRYFIMLTPRLPPRLFGIVIPFLSPCFFPPFSSYGGGDGRVCLSFPHHDIRFSPNAAAKPLVVFLSPSIVFCPAQNQRKVLFPLCFVFFVLIVVQFLFLRLSEGTFPLRFFFLFVSSPGRFKHPLLHTL